MNKIINNQKGFAALAVGIGLVLLGLFAVSGSSLVNTSGKTKADSVNKTCAFSAAQAGAEFANRRIDKGLDPVLNNQPLGKGNFSTLVSPEIGKVFATGVCDIATANFSFETTFGGGTSAVECGSSLSIAGTTMTGLSLVRTGTFPSLPSIGRVRFSNPSGGPERITGIECQGSAVYQDVTGTAYGDWIDIQDCQFPQGATTIAFDSVTFDQAPAEGNVNMEFEYTDRSAYQATCVAANASGGGDSDCMAIDCEKFQSASNNLTNIKFNNNCNRGVVLDQMKVACVGGGAEKINEIQITGDDFFYQNVTGADYDTWIDGEDYTFATNPPVVPINKIAFTNNVPQGMTCTFSAKFADASVTEATCEDVKTSGADKTPGYEKTPEGAVTVEPNYEICWEVLCKEITYGAGGPPISVRVNRAKDGTYLSSWMFNGWVTGGETYCETHSGTIPASFTVKANAKYQSRYNKTYSMAENPQQWYTLVNEDKPIPVAGFGGQKTLEACIAPYINQDTGKMSLAPNEVIFAGELGTDNIHSPAADFQDIVLKLSINPI